MNPDELMLKKIREMFLGLRMEEFNVNTNVYNSSERIPVIPGCYGYLVVNNCDVTVFVDNFPLLPPIVAGASGAAFGFMDITRKYAAGVIDMKITVGATVLQVIVSQIFKLG